MPKAFEFCLPITEAKVPGGPEWLHEIKYDGFRLRVERDGGRVRLITRGGYDWTKRYPWIVEAALKAADKLFRDGHQDAYEREAKHLYGLLREAWERALDEVLLGGIVERFRPSVQTQQIAIVADITQDDCQALEAAMTKCSRWLPGHDQAAAARAPVPEPTELKDDIQALENWVATIRKRRPK
jgi:hypothetical protein